MANATQPALPEKKENFVADIAQRILAVITEGGYLSIGRTMLLACFALAMVRWYSGQEIAESQITILLTMIGYLFGGKVIGNAKEAIQQVLEVKKMVQQGTTNSKDTE